LAIIRLTMGRRILIDALAARYGGTAYAAIHLARHLATSPDVSAVVVAARRGSVVEHGLAGEPTVKCVVLPEARRMELIRRVMWEAVGLPRLVAGDDVDLVISMSGMLPRPPGCDVTCLLFNPVMYERRTAANLLRRWAVRRTAGEAQYVAAPSQMMADLASSSIGRECAVTPLGVDHGVFCPGPVVGDDLLCVADFYAHKRHDLIVDAWLRLASPRPRLRLVGDPTVDLDAHARLLARINTLPEADSIVVEHMLPLGHLVAAYQRARLSIVASEHESFCMPLVESMACGVPAVARDLPSLRETGDVGASYVHGDDPAQWAAAIEELRSEGLAYEEARAAALQSAARFSWETFAARVLGEL
jgi:glycosyltransferase involved in cell wall biosynthesis